MKTKFLFVLLTGCLVGLAAWLVHVPSRAQADEIPEKYRETVHKGLEYLAKRQFQDGHWEGERGQHPGGHDRAGRARLAYGARRVSPGPGARTKHKYSANIHKAVAWLLERSQARRNGLIFSEHPSETARYMYGHALATLFLAGASENRLYANDESGQKLRDALTRGVKYIVNAQSTQGGWYHTSKVEGHDFDLISATVFQCKLCRRPNISAFPSPATPSRMLRNT